jgi:predicted RNA-binding protein with PUA-like domain
MYYLAKTDPETYSIDDFKKEKITNWDGVHNYTALMHIKNWQIGDLILVYHSQGQAKIMGLAKVISSPVKDENDPRTSYYAKLEFIKEFEPDKQITLKQIRVSGLFDDFMLVRQGRLSTMPCPDNFIEWLKKLGVLE